MKFKAVIQNSDLPYHALKFLSIRAARRNSDLSSASHAEILRAYGEML
ncbi:hypothetical protein [uncultured Campylobacter sp.]|nr:hypothetical protein [uncultured Campylobacter sp.]